MFQFKSVMISTNVLSFLRNSLKSCEAGGSHAIKWPADFLKLYQAWLQSTRPENVTYKTRKCVSRFLSARFILTECTHGVDTVLLIDLLARAVENQVPALWIDCPFNPGLIAAATICSMSGVSAAMIRDEFIASDCPSFQRLLSAFTRFGSCIPTFISSSNTENIDDWLSKWTERETLVITSTGTFRSPTSVADSYERPFKSMLLSRCGRQDTCSEELTYLRISVEKTGYIENDLHFYFEPYTMRLILSDGSCLREQRCLFYPSQFRTEDTQEHIV